MGPLGRDYFRAGGPRVSTRDGKRSHARNRHIILTPAAIQTNIFNVRRPLYIMTSHPMAGLVLEEVHFFEYTRQFSLSRSERTWSRAALS